MKISPPGPLVCYLLHFEAPVGRAQHYLGSTFESHLAKRLRSHGKGRGARLTRAAIEGGSRLALAALWAVPSREEEMRLKRSGHIKKRCAICNGSQTFDASPLVTPDTIQLSAWNALLWPGSTVE